MNQESSLYAHHHFLTQISAERQTTEISTLGRQETTKVTRPRSRRRWHELRDGRWDEVIVLVGEKRI